MKKFFSIFICALSLNLTLPVMSSANEAKAAYQSLGECERKFVQDFLKADSYYKSSIDGIWGKGTERAILKFANGRSAATIIKKLGKCLPHGATLSNAYSLKGRSDTVESVYYAANKKFPDAFGNCANKLLSSNKKFSSYKEIANALEPCLEDEGQVRLEYRMYDKILDEIGELRDQR